MASAGTEQRARPLVSVIIPAYNAAATIEEALESVLGQDYAPVEVIVVDDGSVDDTAAIVERFGSQVQLVRMPHQGLARTRNTGLDLAQGELIALLDSDDLWLPDKLKCQVDAMTAHPEAAFTYCAVRDGGNGDDIRPPDPASATMDLTEALLMNPSAMFASQSTIMVRRTAIERVGGYDPSFSAVEDLDLNLRLSLDGQFVPQHRVLAVYRPTAASMSTDISGLASATFAVLTKFFWLPQARRYSRLRRRAQGAYAIVFAGMSYQAGDVLQAARWALRAVCWDIRTVKRVVGLPGRIARRALAPKVSTRGR